MPELTDQEFRDAVLFLTSVVLGVTCIVLILVQHQRDKALRLAGRFERACGRAIKQRDEALEEVARLRRAACVLGGRHPVLDCRRRAGDD